MNNLTNIINNVSMYKMVLYSLMAVIGWSVVATLFGAYQFDWLWMICSLVLMSFVAWISNILIARIFGVVPNSESWLISSWILFLIFSPASNLVELMQLAAVVVIAMVSKYLIAIQGKHIFNPAAIGALVISLTGLLSASWWMASPVMLPVVLMAGLPVVWKLKKFGMITTFFMVSIVFLFLYNWKIIYSPTSFLYELFGSWPLLFLGLFMLVEPSTTPGRFYQQIIYGGLVGVLMAIKFSFGPIYSTPELALVIGNIFSFLVSRRRGLGLKLISHKEVAATIHEFRFERGNFVFVPGQYLEWTLAHKKVDDRGNRRYFTIASSPTEDQILIATKLPQKMSSFKKALREMQIGDRIGATNLAGDFLMPKNPGQKMVWIAGGIGVTPYRSMAKWLIDQREKRDIVMFYACGSVEEFAYQRIFEEAEKVGLRMVRVVTDLKSIKGWRGEVGFVSPVMIRKYVADYQARKYYLSGPNAMVENYQKMLTGMGIKNSQIVTDFFPGY